MKKGEKDEKDGLAVLVIIAVVFISAYGIGLMSHTVDVHFSTVWMWVTIILCIVGAVIAVLLMRAHGSQGGSIAIYTLGVIMGTVALSVTLPFIINYHTAVSSGDGPMEKMRVIDLSRNQVTGRRPKHARHSNNYEYIVRVVNSRGDTLRRQVTEQEFRDLRLGEMIDASVPRGWFGWRVLKLED